MPDEESGHGMAHKERWPREIASRSAWCEPPPLYVVLAYVNTLAKVQVMRTRSTYLHTPSIPLQTKKSVVVPWRWHVVHLMVTTMMMMMMMDNRVMVNIMIIIFDHVHGDHCPTIVRDEHCP